MTQTRHGQPPFTISPDDELFDLTGSAPAITSAPADPVLGIVERTMIIDGAATPVTTVRGVAIGEVAGNYLRVYVAQLRLDPHGGMRAGYDSKADGRFPALKESIRQTQINLEPLVCEATGEIEVIDGHPRPLLLVRSGERRYWAIKELGLPVALIRVLPQDMAAKSRLLFTLIQNELREPLPLLDRCDLVAILVEEHRMRQSVIAAYLGYSQGQVSKLYTAARQPTLIRTYLGGESLALEAVEKLAKAIKDDERRALVARYIVQEGLQGTAIEALLNDLLPPGGLRPRADLIAPAATEEDGRVELRLLTNTASSRPASRPTAPKGVPYWKRTTPLRASPVRLLNHQQEAIVSGSPADPEVELSSLRGPALFALLAQQRATRVKLEALEEAYLVDLEAIRAALEDEELEGEPPIELRSVIDVTLSRSGAATS